MAWVIGYAALLLGIGLFYFLLIPNKSFATFAVFERKAGWFTVGMSLTALVFGASAVFGMSGLALKLGWNAIWWTLSGVVFLVILAFAFSKTVWESKSITLADIVAKAFGPEIRVFVSAVLALAWLMVLAGQITAGANILNLIIKNQLWAYLVFTGLFLGYTVLSGQSAILKSGWIQTLLMASGLGVLFVLLLLRLQKGALVAPTPGLGSGLPPAQFLGMFLPVGLAYLFGPDMYSRIFAAKDPKNARNGILFGAFLILVLSVVIVWIGVMGKKVLGGAAVPDNLIPLLFRKFIVTEPLQSLVLVALVSIPLSGADIILMTSATAFTKDILYPALEKTGLKKPDTYPLWIFRIVLVVLAALASLIAFRFKSIIPALLVSYKIFTAGIVPLVFVSLLSVRFGLDLKGLLYRVFAGIYVFIVSVLVLFAEMKWLSVPVANYNLWLAGISTVVLLLAFLLPAAVRKARSGG